MSGERSYHSPLRERQARTTGTRIAEAVLELVSEAGPSGFTIADVAERAEVAERTVYRHYPDRQALLDGVAELVDDQMAEAGVPIAPREAPAHFRAVMAEVFGAFERDRRTIEAMRALADTSHLRTGPHDRRTVAFRDLLRTELDGLGEPDRERLLALMRVLASPRTLYALIDEFDFDAAGAAELIGWAVGVMAERMVADGGYRADAGLDL